MKGKRMLLALAVLVGLLAVPAQTALAQSDIVDIAMADDRFTTLVAAVQAADLVETLKGPGPFTVFAPTDAAFAKLPKGTVDALLNDIPTLKSILLYHVVPGKVMAADVVALDSADTALGQSVAVSVVGQTVRINESRVVITDIAASNGVIHVIDSVLLPPPEAGPNDYIVQKGDTLYEIAHRLLGNGHRYPEIVELTNRKAQSDSSYTHIEDPNLIYINSKLAIPERTIVDIAVADGRFTTLVAAVQAADLVETLSGPGPFTVFAPTDDAFGKLPAGTVEGLLKDIPTLTNILLYHVVPGKVMAADVVNLSSADTALGQPVSIKVENGKVMINDAQVIITDIEASNGVIHVVDTVILPPTQ
jgi:transforming growth factor-beta-induced protein